MEVEKVVFQTERRVREALARCSLDGPAILVVAVSGGPDSLAMLYALRRIGEELDLELHGAHLDHGIRGESSKTDAGFVEETFRGLSLPYASERADVRQVRRRYKVSLEEAARQVRYSFLARVARERGADAIAVGHTADDQAETVLMNIMRGSGLSGLHGMELLSRRTIDDAEVTLVRPLLEVPRRDTVAYCRRLGLQPRLDQTNLSREPMRNRVRLELLPVMEQYNPAVREALVRLSSAAAQVSSHIESDVDEVWEQVACVEPERVALDRYVFGGLSPALQAHVIRRAVRTAKGDLSGVEQSHINGIARLIGGAAGRSLRLPGGLLLSVTYDEATISPGLPDRCPLPPLTGEHTLRVPGRTSLPGWSVSVTVADSNEGGPEAGTRRGSPRGPRTAATGDRSDTPGGSADYGPDGLVARLSRAALGDRLSVRSRKPGDRFQPLGMSGRKKIQDFMVDSRIPSQWRDRVPLAVCGRGIAWVVGWRIADWARVKDDDSGAVELRFSPTQSDSG